MRKEFENILDLERPYNGKHPRMSMDSRAAQFSSFAALTGYEEAIEETAFQLEGEDIF